MVAQLDRELLRVRPGLLWDRLLAWSTFEGRPLTTRGRLLNLWSRPILALLSRLPIQREVHEPLFLIGMGRSGTTFLGRLLALHPEVGFLNEPKALWHRIHEADDLIGSYSGRPGRYRIAAEEATPERRKRAHRLHDAYLFATANGRVLVKYPEQVFRSSFVLGLFPDARFVHLVRHGADSASSVAQWNTRHRRFLRGERHDWWGVESRKWHLLIDEIASSEPELQGHVDALRTLGDDADRAAVEWVLTHREGLRLAAERPERVHRLRYEDLLAEPEDRLAELLDFCRLAPHPAPARYALSHRTQPAPRPRPSPPPVIHSLIEEVSRQLGYPHPG